MSELLVCYLDKPILFVRISLPVFLRDKMLTKALTFLHVAELKSLAERLGLEKDGTKIFLIEKIAQFVQTGKILKKASFPAVSMAKKGRDPGLLPDSLILKGSYKNDLKTRLFFKSLIGEHFHFTAFGIDLINKRWLEGNPLTYKEFAQMWQQEYLFRKQNQVAPKVEWAFINFSKKFLEQNPNASKEQLHKAWQSERASQKSIVEAELQKYGFTIYID